MSEKLAKAQQRLDEIRAEQRRQIQFIGERLGVFARLRDLEREERRVLAAIQKLAREHSA